jgi:hypothetical protein
MPPTKQASVQLENVAELRGSFPDVPFAAGVNYEELVAADLAESRQPMFVTLPLAQFGQVSRNRRRYSEAEVRRMYNRIMQGAVTGQLGHLTEDERSHAFPIPAVKWVGAIIVDKQLWGKAYILSNREDVREYFRVQKATSGRVGTSLYAMGYEEYLPEIDVWDVTDIELEQIDIVHPDRVGVLFAATIPPILTTETLREAVNGDLAVNDFVSFERNGALCYGQVNTIWTEGEVEIPYDGELTVTASEEDPIARINAWHQGYEGWCMADWQFLMRFSKLTKVDELPEIELENIDLEDTEEEMGNQPKTPSTQDETVDVDSRILAIKEQSDESIRKLQAELSQLKSDTRKFARLCEMLGVKDDQDPVLALQAQQSTLGLLRTENMELLETAIKAEVASHVKVDWARAMVEAYARDKKPQTRSDVVSFVQEALAQEHIATILRNAVQKEMGPSVQTPTTTPEPTPVGDDLIIIPGMEGSK